MEKLPSVLAAVCNFKKMVKVIHSSASLMLLKCNLYKLDVLEWTNRRPFFILVIARLSGLSGGKQFPV